MTSDDRPIVVVQVGEPYPDPDEFDRLTHDVQDSLPGYKVVTSTDDLELTKLPEVETFAEKVVDEIEAREEYDGAFEELIEELEIQLEVLKEDLTNGSPSDGPNYEFGCDDAVAMMDTLDLLTDLCIEELHDV